MGDFERYLDIGPKNCLKKCPIIRKLMEERDSLDVLKSVKQDQGLRMMDAPEGQDDSSNMPEEALSHARREIGNALNWADRRITAVDADIATIIGRCAAGTLARATTTENRMYITHICQSLAILDQLAPGEGMPSLTEVHVLPHNAE